jgi:hypothetical protein
MSEEVEIKINLYSVWHMKPPNADIYIDDTLIESTYVEETKEDGGKNIIFKSELQEGPHKIKIVMSNKLSNDTKLDDKGNIIKDKLLFVNDISIDQIDLGYLLYKASKFYPVRVNHLVSLPEEMTNQTCLGYNGEWVLEFSVPTYIWLLENL